MTVTRGLQAEQQVPTSSQSFSQQPPPHQQRSQGDLQWDEEDMTNLMLLEDETLF